MSDFQKRGDQERNDSYKTIILFNYNCKGDPYSHQEAWMDA